MNQDVAQDIGTVILADESYTLIRLPDAAVSYEQQLVPETPWDQGEPPLMRDGQFTWHQGAFKSREGLPATYEYTRNLDTRFMFRLTPSPAQVDLTLPDVTETPDFIFEAIGYVWVCAGRYLYRITPATNTVTLSRDFGVGVKVVTGLEWESQVYVTTDDTSTESLWMLNFIHTPDAWLQSATVSEYRLTAGINRLYAINQTGRLRNIVSGLDPMIDTNWADNVQVGDTETLPTSLIAYERTVFVGKPEGMFGVGDDGFGMPLVTRMPKEQDNCFGMMSVDPWVFIPHVRGLYRFIPGTADAIGLSDELLNESPVQGRWTGFTVDDRWIYGALRTSTETFIVAASPRQEGALGFGPYIWNTWLQFTENCRAIKLSAMTSPARLWFGKGTGISYVALDSDQWTESGEFFTYKLRFDDRHSKDFPKVDLEGLGLSEDATYTLAYSIDNGSFLDLDINGNQMVKDSDGLTTYYLPSTAHGRQIQFRLTYSSTSASEKGEVLFLAPFASPQSRKIQTVVFHVKLQAGIRNSQGIESRSALSQFNDLLALSESPSYINTIGPWGRDILASVKSVRIVNTEQQGHHEPAFIAQVQLQIRGIADA